jgi:hypothetical protein
VPIASEWSSSYTVNNRRYRSRGPLLPCGSPSFNGQGSAGWTWNSTDRKAGCCCGRALRGRRRTVSQGAEHRPRAGSQTLGVARGRKPRPAIALATCSRRSTAGSPRASPHRTSKKRRRLLDELGVSRDQYPYSRMRIFALRLTRSSASVATDCGSSIFVA